MVTSPLLYEKLRQRLRPSLSETLARSLQLLRSTALLPRLRSAQVGKPQGRTGNSLPNKVKKITLKPQRHRGGHKRLRVSRLEQSVRSAEKK